VHADVIAIDGPAASGKSTVARRVAAALGRLYVDSGAVYRAVAWEVNRRGIDPRDARAVSAAAARISIATFAGGGAVRFKVGGIEPGDALRTEEVNAAVSPVAAVPAVRALVTGLLREMPRFGSLVVEGRDIGTAVFPEARAKFYLEASPEERARRRHAESRAAGLSVSAVRDSIGRRDRIDSSRTVAPLSVAPDATVIDTTALSIDEVTDRILKADGIRTLPRPDAGPAARER